MIRKNRKWKRVTKYAKWNIESFYLNNEMDAFVVFCTFVFLFSRLQNSCLSEIETRKHT
jgi:hypothetical protein